MSTHWSVSKPVTTRVSMPMLRRRYSMLVELKTPDEVFGSTMSSSPGATASSTFVPRAPGDEVVADLVIEAAIAAVLREVLDHGVHDLGTCLAKGRDEPAQVGHDDVAHLRVEV